MRTYGVIPIEFWSDPLLCGCSTHARLLAAYLIGGPHTNELGCFSFPINHITHDFTWSKKIAYHALDELSRTLFLIYDNKTEWILIDRFLFWFPIESPEKARMVEKLFSYVPGTVFNHKLMQDLLDQVPHLNESFREDLTMLLKHTSPIKR